MEATKAAPPIIEFSFTNLELPFASIRTDCLVESKVFRSTGKAAAEAGFVRANILAAILAISIPLRAASKILKKVAIPVKDREIIFNVFPTLFNCSTIESLCFKILSNSAGVGHEFLSVNSLIRVLIRFSSAGSIIWET